MGSQRNLSEQLVLNALNIASILWGNWFFFFKILVSVCETQVLLSPYHRVFVTYMPVLNGNATHLDA